LAGLFVFSCVYARIKDMKFDIITIFPEIFGSYFNESILKRAQKEKLIEIKIHNLRDYTSDKHKTVDDTPYGGGAGMILKVQPIYDCVEKIKSEIRNPKSEINSKSQISNLKSRIILFSAKGKKYTQKDAVRLSKYDNLILICGRYEGVDERVAEHIADEEISIGDYVLTGGEIPAMILVDSVSRLIPGVLGNVESLAEESFNEKWQMKNGKCVAEYPQYTKPEEFSAQGGQASWKVPEILLSGNHQKISKWRESKR
jgi:tRNA (guanine37-N1)-methyltransferase